ncbi:glycosyltransferase [Winogradskyella litorisediminis]|uniref:Glycosyltransferase n=1 Tax=Winogradskyella litorisediminis TaxID=1156618 RepID=A0ABW3NCP8_9FLAO
MKLVIISHTEHYKTSDGTVVGWSPTVNEINHLADSFTSITHVAMLHAGTAPKSTMAYTSQNIDFVALPVLGGTSIYSKLKSIVYIPKVISKVRKALKDADAFQLRTPTGIAVFLIPYLTFFSKKKGWYKYAGNWNQKKPPLGYRFQRWMLKKQKRRVTINGAWENQPHHCKTFENPCLTDVDVVLGKKIVQSKLLDSKLNFCYVGRLETPKGVKRIIEAFKGLSDQEKNRVGDVHLVGDGEEKLAFETMAKNCGIHFVFHGYLDRTSVFEIYKKSHFFLMPTSASEGFPKVIAEASNFGCVPIVSNVSAIGQYIHHRQNGFVISPITSEGLVLQLKQVLQLDNKSYEDLLTGSQNFSKTFTFSHYTRRIHNEILVTYQ